jgi:RimJ/RimL family protein N-acetyltransferase
LDPIIVAPILTTERLVLRPQRRSDFDLLVALYAGQRSRYIGGPLAPAKVWANFMNSTGHWPILGMGGWAIDIANTGQSIGEVAVCRPPDYPETELGWALFDGFEGHGYALESASAARDWAKQVLGAPSLVSYIDPDNIPSIRLAERLGAQRDHGAATPNGDPCLIYRHW